MFCNKMDENFSLSLNMKQRSNVISYVTVNDSPDSDSSLSSPYASDALSTLRSSGGVLEPSRGAGESSSSRTIIVPLKTQLNDCTVATQASGKIDIYKAHQWWQSEFNIEVCFCLKASLYLLLMYYLQLS